MTRTAAEMTKDDWDSLRMTNNQELRNFRDVCENPGHILGLQQAMNMVQAKCDAFELAHKTLQPGFFGKPRRKHNELWAAHRAMSQLHTDLFNELKKRFPHVG